MTLENLLPRLASLMLKMSNLKNLQKNQGPRENHDFGLNTCTKGSYGGHSGGGGVALPHKKF
uniref:Uncharacterized protein n=1 Tax=Octopus bimaculoides TaxID=37653 RepID=A0A0L8GC67_OCTBM